MDNDTFIYTYSIYIYIYISAVYTQYMHTCAVSGVDIFHTSQALHLPKSSFPCGWASRFGKNCEGNILHNYSPDDTWATVSRIAMFLATICGFPIAFTGRAVRGLCGCAIGHVGSCESPP